MQVFQTMIRYYLSCIIYHEKKYVDLENFNTHKMVVLIYKVWDIQKNIDKALLILYLAIMSVSSGV